MRCPSLGEEQESGCVGRDVKGNKGHMAFTLLHSACYCTDALAGTSMQG